MRGEGEARDFLAHTLRDADGGGLILFGEFCGWCAARHVGGMALSSEQMQREVVDTAIPRLNHNIAAVGGDVTSTVDAIRDALTMRWKSLSNGSRGQDKLSKLFSVLDEDNSGALRLAEFSTAIRRAGQVRKARSLSIRFPLLLHPSFLSFFNALLSSCLGLTVVLLLIDRPDHSADGVRR